VIPFPASIRLPEHDFCLASTGSLPYQMMIACKRPTGAVRPVPLVFVHGACSNGGASWEITPDGRPGWASLALAAGYPTYVVDLPGHGRSSQPPDFATMGLDKAVTALQELLAEIGPAVLFGHSMGGAILTRLLSSLTVPQRARVRATVLVDPARAAGMGRVELNAGPTYPDLPTMILPVAHALDMAAPQPFSPQALVAHGAAWIAPESGRSFAEMIMDDYAVELDRSAYAGTPTLLLAAEWARGVGRGTIESYRDFFGLEITRVGEDWGMPGHGHGLNVEVDNDVIAGRVLAWLDDVLDDVFDDVLDDGRPGAA
jgi:pimeloyl-ACP methyl ester carboxylesterase